MNSLYLIVAALATVALIGTVGATTLLQQLAFAVWNPGDGLPESPKGHGDEVSNEVTSGR